MSRVDDLLKKISPKKSRRPKKQRPRKKISVVMMERSWIEDLHRPDATLVTCPEDCQRHIDDISSRIDDLKRMDSSSTDDVVRRLFGWRKGWTAIKRRYEDDTLSAHASRKGPPASELARKAAKREKDSGIRSSMKGK